MKDESIRKVKRLLNYLGANPKLQETPDWGPKSEAALAAEMKKHEKEEPAPPERALNKAYLFALTFLGKKETDSAFASMLEKYWPKAGLPQFKGIAGSARAWCSLFVLACFGMAGQHAYMNAAAISNDRGQKIEWKKVGIPKSAVVRINSKGDCKSSSGNHVTFAHGDCSIADVNKAGATFPGLGGNQGDMVKVSFYAVSKICSVTWPEEVEKPAPVTKSEGCGGQASNESTR